MIFIHLRNFSYYIEKVGGKNLLKTVDPLNNKVEILAEDMPDDYFVISPTEDYAILMHSTDGPKKEEGVFEIVHPDDRQPGWRNRTSSCPFMRRVLASCAIAKLAKARSARPNNCFFILFYFRWL